MTPAAFDNDNTVLDKGGNSDDVEALSVWRGLQGDGRPVIISCWRFDASELEEMRRTGRVWVTVLGERMPPIAVSGHDPWGERSPDQEKHDEPGTDS